MFTNNTKRITELALTAGLPLENCLQANRDAIKEFAGYIGWTPEEIEQEIKEREVEIRRIYTEGGAD